MIIQFQALNRPSFIVGSVISAILFENRHKPSIAKKRTREDYLQEQG